LTPALKQHKKSPVRITGALSKKPRLRKNLPLTAFLPELASIILNSTDKSVIQKIYLFGSYAYGRPTKESDIDICVILDNVENQLDININISIALSHRKIVKFDLLVYKEEQFYRSKNPESIEHTIMKKGKILYER